ncbi:Os01g0269500, partial [Oryza sativa Japonica Group]
HLAVDACRDGFKKTRTWMKQVREVAFDAEDCIDTFWCYIGHHYGARGVRCYCVPKVVYTLKTLKVRNNLAIKIQSLRTRVQRVSERRLRYMLNPTIG